LKHAGVIKVLRASKSLWSEGNSAEQFQMEE
jgi:hypothetical protein